MSDPTQCMLDTTFYSWAPTVTSAYASYCQLFYLLLLLFIEFLVLPQKVKPPTVTTITPAHRMLGPTSIPVHWILDPDFTPDHQTVRYVLLIPNEC